MAEAKVAKNDDVPKEGSFSQSKSVVQNCENGSDYLAISENSLTF